MNTYSESEIKILLKNLIETKNRVEYLEKELAKKNSLPPKETKEMKLLELRELEVDRLQSKIIELELSLKEVQAKNSQLIEEKNLLRKIIHEEKKRFKEELEAKVVQEKAPLVDFDRQQIIERLAHSLSQVREQNEFIKILKKEIQQLSKRLS